LEGDRAAVLTIQSAARGIIDYREADWRNPMWWKRWRYLTQNMENQIQAQLVESVYNYQLALMSNSMLSPENFNKVQKEACELFERLEDNLKPWLSKVKVDREKEESDNFKENWKRLVGFDPNDRQAVANWEKSIKAVLQEQEKGRAEAARKAQDQVDFAAKKIEELRQKRLKQQRRR
jgi:hypothetical protein